MIKVGDIVEGNISMNRGGNGYLVSDKLPKDIYIYKNNMNQALHLDIVEVRVFKGKDGKLEGEVIKIIQRFKEEFVGTLQVSHRHAFLVPDSIKMPHDLFIPKSKLLDGKDGQKAVGKITEWKDGYDNPNGEIIEVLGDAGDNDAEIHAILHEYDLPYNFSEDVLDEANAIQGEITQDDIDARRDFRDVTTICIDPSTAKDKDDAISYRVNENGNYEVGVHIADVTHYLRPNTELDKEAFKRGTSVYLVDRVVPMLPERLSNGICSLNPNEDKLCFSAVFEFKSGFGNGEIISEWFGRTIVNVDGDLSYEEAQEIIDTTFLDQVNPVNNAVLELNHMAKRLRTKRMDEDSLDFGKREIKFILDDEGKPVDIEFKVAKDANKLIEEFMLLANKRVGKYINDIKMPSINRYHASPDEVRLEELKELVGDLGYKMDISNAETTRKSLNKLLVDVQDKPEEDMISTLVVRTMQKAIYSSEECGHYGLNFEFYSHFTSPIRRYADVILHRILGRYLQKKFDIKKSKIEGKCNHISERERKAQKAERDSIKYMQCLYMEDKIGTVHEAIISSIQEYGMFVQIESNHAEGLVKLHEIGEDTYYAEKVKHRVVGFNTGEKFCLGDKVFVSIKGVDLERKVIDFKLFR
jgi:ribonuclease R